ncbi:hypothetical protein A2U01_0076328, partial [Trifolium medium]|nr:hypothetical protein [Trifolium medium]
MDYGGKSEYANCGGVGYVGWHYGYGSTTGPGGRGKV